MLMDFDKMSRKVKHKAKAFLSTMSNFLPGQGSTNPFQGSTMPGRRREDLLRHTAPELQNVNFTLQREEGEEDEDHQVDAGEGGDEDHQVDAGEGGDEDHQEDAGHKGDDSAVGSSSSRRSTRRSHSVAPPPMLTREEDKIVIRPVGDRSWEVLSFDGRGHHRQVNAVFGNIIRLHYPDVVKNKNGDDIPVTTWKEYKLAKNTVFGDAQALVWNDFWKRYHLEDPDTQINHATRVFHENAKKVLRDAFSNSRLQVNNMYLKARGETIARFRDSSNLYLSEDEYAQFTIPWMEDCPDAYRLLCRKWASDAYRESSLKH